VIGLDEERLVKGSRKWKMGAFFGVIFFFLLASSVFLTILIVTTVPRGYTEVEKYGDIIALFGITTGLFSIPLIFLYRYYRHLYHEALFEDSSTGDYHKPTPSKCSICGRHPVSRSHHLHTIHGIKKGHVGDYFENCGCKYCIKPIHITGVGV
jgi:hypothetical protein